MKKNTVVFSALLAYSALSAPLAPLRPGERVTFFGDSITHCGDYITYLQLFMDLRHPEWNVRFDNCGWSGDTLGGGINRWATDGRDLGGDRVILMFASNDVGGYLYQTNAPTETTLKQRADRLSAYETNLAKLTDLLRKEGKRVEVMSAKPYDSYSLKPSNPKWPEFNAQGLAKAADITRRFAEREKIGFVDHYTSLVGLWRDYPDRGLGGPDRMHPRGEGHLLMTANILAALGESPFVATVCVNAGDGTAKAENASVSDCAVAPDKVAFTYGPKALPFPPLDELKRDDEIFPISERFNREILKVSGLKEGEWRLLADGRELGLFSSRALAEGVDLAKLDTPSVRLALEASKKMYRLHGLEKDLRILPMKVPLILRAGAKPDDYAAACKALDAHVAKLPADQKEGWDAKTCRQWKALKPKERDLRAECERLRLEMRVKPKAYRLELRRLGETVADLPPEMKERDPARVMALDDAWNVRTATRTRYVLNGLWQARDRKDPARWAWAKLPGPADIPAKGTGTLRRLFVMPKEAAGKRVLVSFPHLDPRVTVAVDGVEAGRCDYPEGEVDITRLVRPGERQTLSLTVTRMNWETLGADFYLDILPKGARLVDPWTECSVARGEITFKAEGEALPPTFRLVADLEGCGETKRFESPVLRAEPGKPVSFTSRWPDARLWDVHTPGNLYFCKLSLVAADGGTLDQAVPFRFGFREVRLDGNRLLLNGTPVHLRGLMCPLACEAIQFASKERALESCRRLMLDGYNFVTDTYGVGRGTYPYAEGMFEACDEKGMLYCHTMPNINSFGCAALLSDGVLQARLRRDIRHLVKRARNHPAIIMYAANHNATGYGADIDPLRIDGRHAPETVAPMRPHRKAATLLWEMVKAADPTRPCHHHESGDLGEWVTANCYLDWMPMQERSDYLEHWSTNGVKPLFLVEWGMPHVANWSSFRGPEFIWENDAFQSLIAAEAASSFRGDVAFEPTPPAFEALRHEESLWARGKPWSWRNEHYFDVMLHDGNFYGIQSIFMAENWRCMRAWGLTAALPWDQRRSLYKRVGPPAVEVPYPGRFENLKKPGPVPDRCGASHMWSYVVDAGPATNWARTVVTETIRRWNQADCAFIGGAGTFTDKRHLFRPGETAEKSLVFVNDCRVKRDYRWTATVSKDGKTVGRKEGTVSVAPGTRGEVPVSFVLPEPGYYAMRAEFAADGWKGEDAFSFSVFPKAPEGAEMKRRVALYDTKGLTAATFRRLGIPFDSASTVADAAKAANERRLVVGRESLTPELLDAILAVRYTDAQALVFEQTKTTLESVGFRVQEYGLRNVYACGKEPALGNLTTDKLRDWTGASTLVPPFNWSESFDWHPETTWAGYLVARVCRVGNRGTVASVIPETPTRGDWRPLLVGGWGLQYAPLVDWRCDFGRVTFCQLDVTGRTVADPMADDLVRRLVSRLAERQQLKKAVWTKADGMHARRWLRDSMRGVLWDRQTPPRDTFVFSSGATKPADLDRKVQEGARVLCAGFTVAETRAWCPEKLSVVQTNGAYFARIARIPPELDGTSNADWAWHGAMDFAAFADPSEEGNAALRVVRRGKGYYVFMQVAPWMIDDVAKPYLRYSRRRAEFLFQRILGNMGIASRDRRVHYADCPALEDDPYRFFRW